MALIDRTPTSLQCGIGSCPAIYETEKGTYLIVGQQVGEYLAQIPLGKVGRGEVAIEVPKSLLEEVLRDTGNSQSIG